MSQELTSAEHGVALLARTEAREVWQARKGLRYRLRRIWFYRYLYLLMLPGLLYFVLFRYGPMWGLIIAFQDFRPWAGGLLNNPWVGLEHFRAFFDSIYFGRLMRNTLLLSCLNIIFVFPAPILLALLLNEVRHAFYKRIIQTISYLPHFISWVVVGGLSIYALSVNVGFVNTVLGHLGIGPVRILGSVPAFYPLILGSAIWKEVGWGAIIYLAAIAGINVELYEVATVDGANRLQKALYITLPGIAPVIIIMLILKVGSILDVNFMQIMIMTGGDAALLGVGDVIEYWVYRVGFFQGNFSLATAVGLFKGVIGLLLVGGANWLARKVTDSSLW